MAKDGNNLSVCEEETSLKKAAMHPSSGILCAIMEQPPGYRVKRGTKPSAEM